MIKVIWASFSSNVVFQNPVLPAWWEGDAGCSYLPMLPGSWWPVPHPSPSRFCTQTQQPELQPWRQGRGRARETKLLVSFRLHLLKETKEQKCSNQSSVQNCGCDYLRCDHSAQPCDNWWGCTHLIPAPALPLALKIKQDSGLLESWDWIHWLLNFFKRTLLII